MAIEITYTDEGDLLVTCGSESCVWPLAAHMSMAKLMGSLLHGMAVEIKMKPPVAPKEPSPAPASPPAIAPAPAPAPVDTGGAVSGWPKPWPVATALVRREYPGPDAQAKTVVEIAFSDMQDLVDAPNERDQNLANLLRQSRSNIEGLTQWGVDALGRKPLSSAGLPLAEPLPTLKFNQIVQEVRSSAPGDQIELQFVFPPVLRTFRPD